MTLRYLISPWIGSYLSYKLDALIALASAYIHWLMVFLVYSPGFNVVAAGDKQIHQQALDSLQWQ